MNRSIGFYVVAAAIASTGLAPAASAQSGDVFCQPVQCGSFRVLTAEEKGRLLDPFFQLVLAQDATVRKLADVEQRLMGTAGEVQRRFFAVDEEIKSSVQPAGRRAAIDFVGKNGTVELRSNVFLSFSFASTQFPTDPDLEVLAWDDVNGVYNYYKLDGRPASAGRVWKLSASSGNVDNLSLDQRRGTCLHCHASGVPIMKELRFPWNNWHSGQSRAAYLQQGGAGSWPVAADQHFQSSAFFLGEDFEKSIQSAIARSNQRRFDQLMSKQPDGKLAVADARRVLRPLFETTEVNLVSAAQQSGLHPLSGTPQNGPSQPVRIPNSFFLASAVLGSGAINVNEANQFQAVAIVKPADYKALIENSAVQIAAGPTGKVRGDTHFAWFAPEQGFVASNWITTLVEKGVVSKEFAAAVAAADLETPVFSQARAELLRFVPASFVATPGEPHPDALTRAVRTALEDAAPAAGSVAAELLETLKNNDPLALVRARVTAYKDRIAGKLAESAPAAVREAELKRLFGLLIERRQTFAGHPLFGSLVESEALLPMP